MSGPTASSKASGSWRADLPRARPVNPVPNLIGYTRLGLAGALAGLLLTMSPLANAAVEHLSVKTPRSFGYVIGDTIEHEVSLALDPGFELDLQSIPEPGRVSRWLSLNDVTHEGRNRDGTSRHTIRLRFQVVNAAQSVIGAGTPPLSLRIVGPEDDFPALVPGWAFTISPMLTPENRPPGRLPDLRPALLPEPASTTMRTARVAALGVLLLGLVALIARRHLAARIGTRSHGHFERAYRRIQRRMKGPEAPVAYADALVEMHTAFNATAGRAVFEHDLERFFVEHARFKPLRAPISALFAESGAVFYGSGADSTADSRRLDSVRDLCRACRDAERIP